MVIPRYLIVIRNFNEKFAVQFIDEEIITKICYTLLLYKFIYTYCYNILRSGNVDYYVLFSSKTVFNKNAVIGKML